MTNTQGVASLTTTDPSVVAADQLLLLLKKRNILWKLQLATSLNINPTTGSDIRIQVDGDSDPILARTLIGPIMGTERVAVVFVPPAGYYIIGTIGGGQRQFGLPAPPVVCSGGGTATSSTTEIRYSTMPLYSFVSLPGVRYKIVVDGAQVNGSVAGERGLLQVRDGGSGTPGLGSPVWDHATDFQIGSVAARAATVNMQPSQIPTSTVHTLGLFIQNITGIGTMAPAGTGQMWAEAVGTV